MSTEGFVRKNYVRKKSSAHKRKGLQNTFVINEMLI